MLHKEILKLLLPVELGPVNASDIEVEGVALDTAKASIATILNEAHPDTMSTLIDSWERVLGLTPLTTDPVYQRAQSVLAKFNARGGQSVAYIQQVLRAFIGYDALTTRYKAPYCDDPETLTDDHLFNMNNGLMTVTEYEVPYCDDPDTFTDGRLYAMTEDHVYKFTVTIDNSLIRTVGYSAASIQAIINEIKPAHTQGILSTGVIGFFTDDPNSLTNLSTMAQ